MHAQAVIFTMCYLGSSSLDFKAFLSSYKTHPDFETKNAGKKCVLYTGEYSAY